MGKTLVVAALAIVAHASLAHAADIDVMSNPHLRVRTHDAAGLSPETRAAAMAAADTLLRRAGIAATWIMCQPPTVPMHDACNEPVRRTDVVVRFVRVPESPAGARLALGSALIDPKMRGGSLATIYVNRVERLTSAGTALDMLLGRAVAHEIGHLLLGTPQHALTGLMKGVWTRDVLAREQPSDWWFTESDARTMRNAVRQRAVQELALGSRLIARGSW
jgi:hypothetical protein